MQQAKSSFRHGEGPTVVEDHDPPHNPIVREEPQLVEATLTEVPATTEKENKKNIIIGSVWMVVLAVSLFFLPALNGLVAGTVGGYMIGTAKRAVLAAVIPGLISAGALWVLLATLDFPYADFFVGAALGVHIILSEVGLFLGAAIGGTVAQTKIDRFNRA